MPQRIQPFLYALYNHLDLGNFAPYSNCPQRLKQEQLGITVTPMRNIVPALPTWGARSFESLHSCPDTIPVRCLAECPRFQPNAASEGTIRTVKVQVDEATVYSFYQASALVSPDLIDLEAFPAHLYSTHVGIYPRRIAVIDTEA